MSAKGASTCYYERKKALRLARWICVEAAQEGAGKSPKDNRVRTFVYHAICRTFAAYLQIN